MLTGKHYIVSMETTNDNTPQYTETRYGITILLAGATYGPFNTRETAERVAAEAQTRNAMRARTISVRVADLCPGDYLPSTKRTIVSVSRGARTTARHHEVTFRRNSGKVGTSEWRSETIIDVVRGAE